MAGHQHDTNPDIGPAFTGLIVGAIVIGAILYGIVLWTNARFAEHHKAEKKASISVVAPTVV
ncbi:hypothetical protein [Gemmatimonas phototrophica]|uniref:Uncharacterized protein n=1 Tax=Gemmatimonas phototrophica TaxID=1379270 RepID=A0A143BI42_9BACT|nr:hypothetical protein [Gemmatimonas phototrophica]AMW04130.1 hypothetical protein GEMMAAP_03320 [Gemmatimonas phototrophica]